MRKVIATLSFIFLATVITAQKNINNYEYIIVPNQYSFTKEVDQYQMNSLTKFLFERAGFKAFMESEKPVEVVQNNCSSLKANVIDESNMFTTRVKIQLLDCFNTKVYETQIGKTKEKDFKKAYHAAIRSAFKDIEALNYAYVPLEKEASSKIAEKVKKEIPVKPQVKENIKPQVVEKVQPKVKKKDKMVKSPKVVKTEIDNQKIAKVKKPLNTVKPQAPKLIEGNYMFNKWGKSSILKKGDSYVAKGGDENFEFATIFKTSKKGVFIIKYVMSKQPQLVQLTKEGNLEIDSKSGVEVVRRIK